ncbi:MAG: hypothetical protein M1834_007887 [Cirrosporium novae-zelandiae]|nr:MAG: hypothetical protein M1834_007887 [Cirrosporium novae-zelandiae]
MAAKNTELDAAAQRHKELIGVSGPQALFQNLRVFSIAAFACLGGLLYGYNQGVFSGVLTMYTFEEKMGEWTADTNKKGWLTSILELGAWVGTLYSGFLAEVISRKYAILVNTGIFVIGVIIQATAIDAGHSAILGGRFVTGLGVGSLSMIVPMYNAECAPPEVRGLLVGLQQVAIEFGIMTSYWIDYGTNYIGGTSAGQSNAAWVLPLCLQLIPALILGIGMIFMPFSPRWLMNHGHEDDARQVLARLRDLPPENELIEVEFLEIKAQCLFEKRTTAENFPHLAAPTKTNLAKLQFVAIGSLFKTKPMFRRVIVAAVCMFFQQWTGVNAVLYYAPSIFQGLGMNNNTTNLLATGVVGIVMFVASFPAVLYIDKVGRKPVLILGALGMASCHIIIAIIMAMYEDSWPDHRAAGWACVAMVWLFAIHFGWSWGPCSWILISEVWPLSSRAYGIAIASSSKYGTYVFFGVITFIGSLFVWRFVPETKRLTLEEMDTIFGSQGVAARDQERMAEINHEIGLDRLFGHMSEESLGEKNIDAGEVPKGEHTEEITA